MKVLSLFSGIGAFEKALDRLEVNYELVNYCEIDKYASKAYAMMHDCDESLNLGDITKIDTTALPNDIDLITYGFPCQDISLAGKQKGFEEDGERTRSGLFFEALRIIEDTKPRIAIAENVKNLTSKKFSEEFDIVLSSLEQAGYNNYWKILNAKDFGVPQNRERVFIISIRKDIDNGIFEFPKPFELKSRLKDMLEDEVDEKYFLTYDHLKRIDNWKSFQNPLNCVLGGNDISPTITTRIAISDGGGINASTKLYSNEFESKINLRNGKYENIKIRYYTPLDCWKLMGFEKDDYIKAQESLTDFSLTNNQLIGCLYKQAGNSIVVDVLVHLFKSLFKALESNKHAEIIKQPTLFDLDKEEEFMEEKQKLITNENMIKWNEIDDLIGKPVFDKNNDAWRILDGYKRIKKDYFVSFTDSDDFEEVDLNRTNLYRNEELAYKK